ncbi:transposase family protein [Rhodococcus sp. 14-2470-1a]|uniref:transposase family protein n=1 Tax=Rhodococcus sp. 14-2470-1a TaxID=2023150 RepID=UPI0015C5E831|nr:transposase family protein [Rhodococcus sp. 14-2470-1a]
MDQSTTVLFGLPGVRVDRVTSNATGARLVEFTTDDEQAAACPSCGVVSTSVKGHAVTRPKDVPHGEESIQLQWNKTRWRCREDYCQRGSFTESIDELPPRARLTGRLGRAMGYAIGDAARSVAEVAAAHGVSWPTAHRRFVALAEQVLTEPAPVCPWP